MGKKFNSIIARIRGSTFSSKTGSCRQRRAGASSPVVALEWLAFRPWISGIDTVRNWTQTHGHETSCNYK